MMEKYQQQMQIGSWVLIGVLALTGIVLWQNIGRTNASGNIGDTITVSGTGKVSAAPDIAVANIAISVEGATAKTAQNNASIKSKSVVDYLKEAGIEDADIKTSGYNIYPQYNYNDGTPRIRGYQVTQSLTVKIRDLDKANSILDGVVSAGANQVNSLQFQIDEQDKLRAEARREAIKDANEKAEELEDELGINLGKIVGFSESNDSYPIIYARDVKGMGIGGGGAEIAPIPELPAGENEITVNVNITYQIK